MDEAQKIIQKKIKRIQQILVNFHQEIDKLKKEQKIVISQIVARQEKKEAKKILEDLKDKK
jgi:hypothetical protein